MPFRPARVGDSIVRALPHVWTMLDMLADPTAIDIRTLAARLLAAYLRGNKLPPDEVPVALRSIFRTLRDLSGQGNDLSPPVPAVPIKKSVTRNYLICLEDGRKLKFLKRYLRTRYGLSPEDYRAKWGLPPHYPMVAPRYAAQRSEMAKKTGFGRRPPRA